MPSGAPKKFHRDPDKAAMRRYAHSQLSLPPHSAERHTHVNLQPGAPALSAPANRPIFPGSFGSARRAAAGALPSCINFSHTMSVSAVL